jgi:fermentation-respiration switch protein FrsA (DUF1100 family)
MSLSNIVSIVAMAAAAYAAVLLALFVFQSRLVFFPNMPSRAIGPGPDSIGLAHNNVEIITEDGIKLHGWHIPAPERRGVVLFFHGNAGNISHRLDSLKIFNELNLDTLIFDYRGYGRSQGRVSEKGTYRDAEAAWRFLREEHGIPAAQIVLFGRSLGAAIAAYVASRHRPGALILESGFVSVPDMAAAMYPWLPARRLARIGYPTGEYLHTASCPVLIVHSRDDEIIPFEQGRKLFELAGEPKHFLELRGGHNDGFLVSGRRYLDGFDNFLAASLGKGSAAAPPS